MKYAAPSELKGTVKAPPSKSMMIRAAAAGFLSPSGVLIRNPSFCRDADAALSLVQALGSRVRRLPEAVFIGGRPGEPKQRRLHTGESGLCIRLFTPISGLYPGEFTITGEGTLMSRPMTDMESSMLSLGGRCVSRKGTPPLTVCGPLQGGTARISGRSGSQFLSGLLMALPLCSCDSRILVNHPVSLPYIRMTLAVLKDFSINVNSNQDLTEFDIPGRQKYQGKEYSVEGDWSGAAFWLAAAAVNGDVTLTGLRSPSLQADRSILAVLKETGAHIETKPDAVRVRAGMRKSFFFDAAHCPDLFPPLAVLGCFCSGTSVIHGVDRLIHKESNRAETLQSELTRLGADIKIQKNSMVIAGQSLQGGTVFSHHDHRIAMAGAVAGLLSRSGVRIEGWDCIQKSYPEFSAHLMHLGGQGQ
ncbi:MAG: 3-phosphoshikimate 1-carboxyvinyltransferase [Candidatus Aminicenantaceae bacterium]